MDGAFLINKPSGLSSHDVVARLRRTHKGVRFGHAGTLDPDASGLLLLLAGRATKMQDVFLGADKEYEGEFLLGVGTDTDDTSGEVIARDSDLKFWDDYSEQSLVERIISTFSGEQQQIPPQFSAVQVQGQRSYALARSGVEVEHKPRVVQIEFKQLSVLARDKLYYRIQCSKGTYVRSLARDIGQMLNSHAVAERICRLRSGSFSLEDSQSLDETLEGRGAFIPLAELLVELPRVVVSEQQRELLENGRQELLAECGLNPSTTRFGTVFSEEGELVALLRHSEEKGWYLGYVLRRE